MPNKEPRELGRAVGADIFAITGSAHDWFMGEIRNGSGADLPKRVAANSIWEPVFFAVSHVTKVVLRRYRKPYAAELLPQMNDAVVGLLSEMCFESELKKSDFEAHKAQIGEYFYHWLGAREEYYLGNQKKVSIKFASLISSSKVTDGVLLRAMLAENFRDETCRIPNPLLRAFVARIVESSYGIPPRHFK